MLDRGDALIVADVQRDFLPGGSLAISGGDRVIAPINQAIESFERAGLPVFLTRDWHPPDHCSFRERGGVWPVHCVAGTPGAEFARGFRIPPGAAVISKATEREKEAYSAFEGTPLHEELRSRGVSRVFVAGLATDYCVLNTVRDAVRLGYRAVVLEDAIGAVDASPGDGERALGEMRRLGAAMARSYELGEADAA